ncbi:MAG: rRNA (guanine527-N7)-methyltransferase [Solirubrobacterales bacterium]|nr:rRNA (guanine527-N7)-methyltransferase [Solirubrobacterales bacterium]
MTGKPAQAPPSLATTLEPATRAALERLVEQVAEDPTAPSSVTDPQRAWRVHVADSLSVSIFPQVAEAGSICDIGAGAGFPGLVLAAVYPGSVDLVESVGRKCEFMRRAIEAAQLDRARVVCERSETWATGEGREAYDLVTARAVARLATLAELASPLLRDGGHLIAWKGKRDAGEEAELERAAERTGMLGVEVRAVGPYAGSHHRHLHLLQKRGPTPAGLPRRPGMAKKRPFGAERNPGPG